MPINLRPSFHVRISDWESIIDRLNLISSLSLTLPFRHHSSPTRPGGERSIVLVRGPRDNGPGGAQQQHAGVRRAQWEHLRHALGLDSQRDPGGQDVRLGLCPELAQVAAQQSGVFAIRRVHRGAGNGSAEADLCGAKGHRRIAEEFGGEWEIGEIWIEWTV